MMRREIRSVILVTAACFPLSGCLLPPAISIASLVLDVGSFAVSGKTMTDHGLSVVAREDCALLRVFDGEVCQPYTAFEEDISLAALEPLAPGSEEEIAQLVAAESGNPLFGLDYAVAGTALDPELESSAFVARRKPTERPPGSVQVAAAPGETNGFANGEMMGLSGYLADHVGPSE